MAATKKSGFDLTVHRRDAKGKIYQVDPYRLHISDGEQRYERPPGSGNFYSGDGKLIKGAQANLGTVKTEK